MSREKPIRKKPDFPWVPIRRARPGSTIRQEPNLACVSASMSAPRPPGRLIVIPALLAAGLAIAGAAMNGGIARADVVLEANESATFRGHFNQLYTDNSLFDGVYIVSHASGACVPTSTANSFVYLLDQYGIKGLGGANNAAISYETINTLGSANYMMTSDSGTSFENAALGKEKYLQDNAANLKDSHGNPVAIQTVGQSNAYFQAANGPWVGGISRQVPTADFIQKQLADGEDVELTFAWSNSSGTPTGGGHAVNLYAIDYNATTNSGSISFIDPTGGTSAGLNYTSDGASDITTGSLTMIAGDYLLFKYPGKVGGASLAQGDNASASTYGIITGVLAESPVPLPVPEPTTLAIFVIGMGLFCACRRNLGVGASVVSRLGSLLTADALTPDYLKTGQNYLRFPILQTSF